MSISRKLQRKKLKQEYKIAKKAMKDGTAWMDDDGVHFIEHDEEAEKEFYDELTSKFQQNIMESELWDQMVEEYGEVKAKELLAECKADSGNAHQHSESAPANSKKHR